MITRGLGKRLKMIRLDKGFTADKLSELCNINAMYLRQIEGGKKTPSLPLFIDICNSLQISPNYLLQDDLITNEISQIKELNQLWEHTTPSQQIIVIAMIQAALKCLSKTE